MTKSEFLGVDLSTQQVKVVAVDADLNVTYEEHVHFDKELPLYCTKDGVCWSKEDKLTYTAPVLMWTEAVDLLLHKMKSSGFDFSTIKAISGTGQQHGSVYWTRGAEAILQEMNSTESMHKQLKGSFSVEQSPMWMDSSTSEQCKQLESSVGGAMNLSKITGSPAYERYTGPQIAKIYQQDQDAYMETERISLVSSFAASLFLGHYAAIDESDGSGMNLFDIQARKWDKKCLDACAPSLAEKLGDIVPTSTVLGSISSYHSDRYGFSPECKIVAFTGDNPASLAGMRLQTGDICVSLGTSDTLSIWIDEPRVALEGSVFVNPVDTNAYMALLCFKNGSLTRERIKDSCADASWEIFNNKLEATTLGNNGNIGIYFDVQEITPFAAGCFRFNKNNEPVDHFDSDTEIRALVEGQFMAKRIHAENLGYKIGPSCHVLATGGASANKAILQVLSDVFNTIVYTSDVVNATCLGCAYRAKHSYLGCKESFSDVVANVSSMKVAAKPNVQSTEIYDALCRRYKALEERISKSDSV